MRKAIAFVPFLVAACVSEEASQDGVELDDPFSLEGGKSDQVFEPTRFPIVLVHGFNASPQKNGFGPEVVSALCADGHSVFAPQTPAFASAAERGEVLADAIDAILDGATDACGRTPTAPPTKVNIIAHSMGGLDTRFVIGSLGYGDRIDSVITISTPHRGSAIADMMLGLLDKVDSEALSALASFLGRPLGDDSPDLLAAMTSLAEASSGEFEAENPDDHRVRFQSWAGLSNVAGIINPRDVLACENKLIGFSSVFDRHVMHVALKPIAFVVAHGAALNPNDGLVRVESAKWGTFRGCIPADHADEVGAFPNGKFPHVDFLRRRAFELAATGA